MTRSIATALAVAILGASLCGRAAAEPAMRFTDVTAASGIDFTTRCGDMPSRHILEVDGAGLALFDYDNDGDLDVFFANGATLENPEKGPGCRLYANNGDGTFRDVTIDLGIAVHRWAMGVAVGDCDGNGLDDVYITCYGPNVLLANRNSRFVDVTGEAGVGDDRWGTSAAFGDIDNDGDLDLYVVNYLQFDTKDPPSRAGKSYKGVSVMAGPHGLTAQADVLYENVGATAADGPWFRDITQSSGCGAVAPGYGLTTAIVDVDADGKQDIYVGNDSTENFLFQNAGGRKFENIGVFSGVSANLDGSNQATMGVAVGDVDGNGRPDLFTTNFSSDTNTLHVNLDGYFFEDRTSQFGLGILSKRYLGWGCGFYDCDLDGDEDLMIANGHVYPEAATHNIDSDYAQPPLLLERAGGRFTRVSDAGAFFQTAVHGRSLAFGDLDGDGDVDAVLTLLNGKARVLRNDAAAGDRLVVELKQSGGNHRAYGSMIELTAGDSTQRRWVTGGGSFQSVNAPHAYFGLGADGPDKVKLRVTWPGGTTTVADTVPTNTRVTIERNGKFTTRKLETRSANARP